jgi:hypothetical protein
MALTYLMHQRNEIGAESASVKIARRATSGGFEKNKRALKMRSDFLGASSRRVYD